MVEDGLSHCQDSLGKAAKATGEFASSGEPQAPQKPCLCPQCGSNRVWKSGLRYSKTGAEVQRWLCRVCGFRFSKSFANLDEKVHITCQSTEKSDPAESSLHSHILRRELTAKPLLKDSSFKVCENVGSHGLSVQSSVGKSIYAFPF